MKKIYYLLTIFLGAMPNVQADCADGVVTCKWAHNKRLPDEHNPPHKKSFGCEAGGLFHMGSCNPIPENLAQAQKICERYYGGVDSISGCSVDWGSVFHEAGKDIETVHNFYEGGEALGSVLGVL